MSTFSYENHRNDPQAFVDDTTSATTTTKGDNEENVKYEESTATKGDNEENEKQEESTATKSGNEENGDSEESTEKTELRRTNDNMVGLFESFMSEIDSLPKTTIRKIRKAEGGSNVLTAMGTGDEECMRLTIKFFASSYEVLRLGPEATEDEIKKQFRKISLIIHPDKCKNEKAEEAFNVVSKAYEELQRPEFKEKYKKVLTQAKKVVLKERKRLNAIRRQLKEPLLLETEEAIKADVAAKCEELLKLHGEQREYADRTRKANEARERKLEEELKEEGKRKQEESRVWCATRDTRVGGWRGFQSAVQSKNIRLGGVQPVKLQREQRAAHHGDPDAPGSVAAAIKKRKAGIDESYKQCWR